MLEHYQAELRSFRGSFKKCGHKITTADVHHLRVSIKKLRVLNQILATFDPRGPSNIQDLLNRLFKKAGALRELQLNYKLTSRYRDKFFLAYRFHLKNCIPQAGEDLSKEIGHFKFDKISKFDHHVTKLLIKIPTNRQKEQALQYLENSIQSIERLASEEKTDKRLHSIRKHLRKAHVTTRVLIDGKDFDQKLKELHSQLKKLMDLTGDWHDQVVLLHSIHDFLQGQPEPSIAGLPKLRIEDLDQSCVLLKSDLIRTLSDSLTFLTNARKQLESA